MLPGPEQLFFVFAASPQGSGRERSVDASTSKAPLPHAAKKSESSESALPEGVDTRRLLDRVADEANLAAALDRVVSNKGAPGVDQQTVAEVRKHADSLLPKLREALFSERYVPGDIRRVWIPKPGGGQRGLGIPNVVDRWVQQAVLQVLEPIYDPTFHPSSHGFRPGRGMSDRH